MEAPSYSRRSNEQRRQGARWKKRERHGRTIGEMKQAVNAAVHVAVAVAGDVAVNVAVAVAVDAPPARMA